MRNRRGSTQWPGGSSRRIGTIASACLAVTLLGLSGTATWSSFATSAAANTSRRAGVLSDAYSSARFWVGAEESLERKYRLEPSSQVRLDHQQAQAEVDHAMAGVAADGTAPDRVIAADIRRRNAGYATATLQLFAATDRGDIAAEIRIDHGQVDPVFGTMQAIVYAQSDRHARISALADRRLLHIEAVARWVTASVVAVGILLILLFAQLRRRHARENAEQGRRDTHQATHDALTGLPNRVLFASALERELDAAKVSGASVAVVLLDLNRFKEINDTLGHHMGDLLLRQVGLRIAAVLGGRDVLARLGGDEFAVLITTEPTAGAAIDRQSAAARRVLAALGAPFLIDDIALVVEASAGLAGYPGDGDTGDLLLQRADIAMYVAKTNHDDLAVYDQRLDNYHPRKLALLADLRQAVVRDELVLYFQPLVEIATDRVRGVEALVRWQHPIQGLLAPDEFILLAEGSGFIHELTHYVLTRSVRVAKTWEQLGYQLQVSVNISARCLLDSSLPETVDAALAAVGLSPALLKLEITESAIITDPGRAQDVIGRLHRLGVALSIDDFGTGYTSLSYLRDLPVQELKIDRSFVLGILSEHKDAVIVRTAIELAQRLGLDSVGEGIESAEILACLRDLGCTVAQGYHLSRPLPEQDVIPWLTSWYAGHHLVSGPRSGP